jgi:hypothetical protein
MSKAEKRKDRHIQYVLDKAVALHEGKPAPKRPKTLTKKEERHWLRLWGRWAEITEETLGAWDEFDRPIGLDLD